MKYLFIFFEFVGKRFTYISEPLIKGELKNRERERERERDEEAGNANKVVRADGEGRQRVHGVLLLREVVLVLEQPHRLDGVAQLRRPHLGGARGSALHFSKNCVSLHHRRVS